MASLLGRLIRRPQKYLRRDFWVPTLAEFRYRGRAGLVFAAPAIVRRRILRERPFRAYVFPSALDTFQLAETYVAWKVLWHCNVEIHTSGANDADFALAWHPATRYTPDERALTSLESRMSVINGRCTDIRKSVVDAVFADVFGYSLEVNPRTHRGTLLCKSERNGAHDARLLEGPLESIEPDCVYQRVVSYETLYGYAEWRTFIVGRKPVAVYTCYRPLDDRFALLPSLSILTTLAETFTQREQELIAAFCDRMHLDFGALDILRDAQDGRLYISDCNNTPTGPSTTSLSIPAQVHVVAEIAKAFEREYLTPIRTKQDAAQPVSS